ncbi:MAG: T9SS type A sorting domain-containing protein, partial [Flavobacteriales bacterium]|nr:T9SS type A sorting domain-containing protein [Flavobacteriales bacterium]
QATVFGQPNNPHWKVFLNNGSGFNTTATTWSLPNGGYLNSLLDYGYNALGASAGSSSTLGNQTWSIVDIDGNGNLDLVVTAESRAVTGFSNQATVFGQPNNPHWKVFLNNGSGFNTTATTWALPNGGYLNSLLDYGYNALGASAGSASTLGNQTWSIVDIDGDGNLDLVVTAESRVVAGFSNQATVFGQPNNPHWKVFLGSSLAVELGESKFIESSLLSVYPNPVLDWVELNLSNIDNPKIIIYNSLGQSIYELDKPIIGNRFSFNLGNRKAGIYYIIVSDKHGNRYSAKIVKSTK